MGIMSRVNNVVEKSKMVPYPHGYPENINQYLNTICLSWEHSDLIKAIFYHPFCCFTILDETLYYTTSYYGVPPHRIICSDDLFRFLDLQIPLEPLKENLYKGFISCMENYLSPWKTPKFAKESDPKFYEFLINIRDVKNLIRKIQAFLNQLGDYYIENGLPKEILCPCNPIENKGMGFYYYTFHPSLRQLDNNIICLVDQHNIKCNPSPHQVLVIDANEFIKYFKKSSNKDHQKTILLAYPKLCNALPNYQRKDKHMYIMMRDYKYYELSLNGSPDKFSPFDPCDIRVPYISLENLAGRDKDIEDIASVLSFFLQRKFSNLQFWSSLVSSFYTERNLASLHIIRLSKNSSYNEFFMKYLENLLNISNLSKVLKSEKFTKENLSDWYSHLYCGVLHLDGKEFRQENYLLKWIKRLPVVTKLSLETIIKYRNTMPLILTVEDSVDISYLETYLRHNGVNLYHFKLNDNSDEELSFPECIRDTIRLILLLGNHYKTTNTKKQSCNINAYPSKDILKNFIESFCTLGADDATPIASKTFYDNYIKPYYNHYSIKPIGPTNFNRQLPELFPNQIECRKYHPKSKTEGIHLFKIIFKEDKWKLFMDKTKEIPDIEKESFSNELQKLIDFASNVINDIQNK